MAQWEQMSPLDKEIKVRVTEDIREKIEAIAAARHLKVADIVREALRQHIDSQGAAKQPA